MNPFLANLIRIVSKEVWSKWRIAILVYVITAMAFLAAAIHWPRVFSSSSTVLVDEETILSPLMRGTAVTTEVVDHSRMASQIILSKKAIDKVLKSENWLGDKFETASPKTIDNLGETIKAKASVNNVGPNLISIGFKDVDPKVAFEGADLLTQIFIEESILRKQSESSSAYEFIDNQVSIYHEKLKSAEEAIKNFRSTNVDASPEAKNNANQRLIELKREIETLELEITATRSDLSEKRSQLSGEKGAENSASIEAENKLNERIYELQLRLDDLQLNYKDTYPDIIQVKGQIAALKKQVQKEVASRNTADAVKRKLPTGSVAQALRSQVLVLETNIASQTSRLRQLEALLDKERNQLASINAVEAEISELTRDYTVNQNMYQNLLEQRETARISMNIDIEQQGSMIKVQEPAFLPVTPKGIRFIHIILAGLVLSFVVPVLIVFGLTILDQKIRSELVIYEEFRLPVLASVYSTLTPKKQKMNILKTSIIVGIILCVWSAYAYAIFLRLQG